MGIGLSLPCCDCAECEFPDLEYIVPGDFTEPFDGAFASGYSPPYSPAVPNPGVTAGTYTIGTGTFQLNSGTSSTKLAYWYRGTSASRASQLNCRINFSVLSMRGFRTDSAQSQINLYFSLPLLAAPADAKFRIIRDGSDTAFILQDSSLTTTLFSFTDSDQLQMHLARADANTRIKWYKNGTLEYTSDVVWSDQTGASFVGCEPFIWFQRLDAYSTEPGGSAGHVKVSGWELFWD